MKADQNGKFPKRILVTREAEEIGDNDPWLQVHEHGPGDIQKDGTMAAVYELVSTGQVFVTKEFIEKKKK